MRVKAIILAILLVLAGAYTCVAQGNLPKQNGPANKTPIPNKPPPEFLTVKSDLSAGVSVYVDDQAGKVVMDVLVTNNGPGAILYGQRTVTLTVKNKGKTITFFSDVKIPALKGTASTAGQQAGSSFTMSHSVPVSWGFDENTIYEVKISPSKTDPQLKNDVAVQVGPNKGKP
jgi:hypothetical protein